MNFLRKLNISRLMKSKPTVSVITLEGTILSGRSGGFGGRKNINLENTRKMIDKAFKQKELKLVCVNVNSPGGSAVQSDLVSQYIRAKSEKHKVDVVVFVEDTAASGGYWLACTGKQIYATRSSVVGSIGVISGTLGFHELIKKYGIERRVFTAGTNKSVLDPLSPLKESDVSIIKNLLSNLHAHFIDHVKASRGDRLKGEDELLFNGEFWTGEKALELGLIDGIDTLDGYIEKKYGDKVKVFRAKKGGGLGNLLSTLFEADFSVLQQLAVGHQAMTISSLSLEHQDLESLASLQRKDSIVGSNMCLHHEDSTTPHLEDPVAQKISQENAKI